jgi:GDSL-like lipase/acylhydrolase family protein
VPTSAKPRRGAVLGSLALAVASVALTLVALEIGLRLFDTETRLLFVKDSGLGHRYIPGFAGRQYVDEAGRSIDLRFNRLGFRGPDHDESKPPGVRRIAVLGDSFVAAVGVEEPDTMVARLEAMLSEASPGTRWEVLNFGVSGYSTAQSLLVWRSIASRFEPDVVVLCFFLGNDPLDNSSRLSRYFRPYFHVDAAGQLVEEPFARTRASLNGWLDEHSRLYVWEKEKTRQVRGRFAHADGGGDADDPGRRLVIYDTQPDPPMREAWAISEALVAALAREVTATGARFVVVGIPERGQILDAEWARLEAGAPAGRGARYQRGYPDEMLDAIGTSHGIPVLSLTPAFRGDPHADALLLQGFHWSERGNALAAQTVYDYLATRQFLAPPAGRPD